MSKSDEPNRFRKSIESLATSSEPTPQDTPLPFMENVKPPQTAAVSGDFLGDIQPQNQQGKNITFYLSHDVLDCLAKLAKQKGISKSKIVDKALRKVLSI